MTPPVAGARAQPLRLAQMVRKDAEKCTGEAETRRLLAAHAEAIEPAGARFLGRVRRRLPL